MIAKKQIISELNTLDSPQLLKILDFILSMRISIGNDKKSKKIKSYLNVRNALKNIKTDLSQEIINGRNDRL